jgi:hypothetical protein
MKNQQKKFYGCLIAAALLACSTNVWAQPDEADPSSEWKHSVIVYLLAPNIDGTVGVGPIDGDIDIDPKTVLDTIDAGFLGGWAAEKGKWGMLLDVVYMDLSEDFKLVNDQVPGELGNKQLVAGLTALYRLSDSLQFMAGIMYTDVSMKLSLDGPVSPRKVKAGDSWADPVVGLRFATPISERWSFAGFGQIGGFGINSDLVWQLTGSFSYRMSQRSHFLAGYRYMDFDYESGSGADRFKFDVAQHGPALGFRFDF